MDDSNKMRRFSAIVHNGTGVIEWLVNNVFAGTGSSFPYQMPNAGGTNTVTIRARLQAQPSIFDEAHVQQLNYVWPGL